MARSSNRVSMFSSNRGRVVKRFLVAAAIVTTVLFFGNAILAGPPEDPETTDYSASYDTGAEDETSVVAAPISRPFALPIVGGADMVQGGDIYGNAVDAPQDPSDPTSVTGADTDTPTDEEDEAATDQLQKADSYQSAVTLTQDFATAYTTYSPELTAQEWVDSLPSLEETAKAKLLESAEGTWPQLADRKSSSKGSVAAQSVTPIYSRDGGATIQLSVTVHKETSYEGATGHQTDSYAVTLERDSDSSAKWIVVAVE